MSLPDVIAGMILLSLMGYVILGGADFGGGVWDLLARGRRGADQREVIAHAIGPIWEANHVWMIIAVVLLFTAFPPAFAHVMTYLHVPVSLMLVGIVLRGSSFVFRKADPAGEGAPSGWQKVFAGSSLLTPVMLGVILGTISTPALAGRGMGNGGGAGVASAADFFTPWLQPFPWAVGLLTLVLFAFLAATYLTLETEDPELVEIFRGRALASAAALAGVGAVVGWLARGDAPHVAEHLTGSVVGWLTLGGGAAALAGTAASLITRHFLLARPLAAATALLMVGGWGFGLHPWLVAGALRVEESAAPAVTLRLVGGALLVGSVILLPAYLYLYRTFKGGIWARPGNPGTRRVPERGAERPPRPPGKATGEG